MRTFLSLFVTLGLVSAAHAAPGDLDTTFSGDGKVITNISGNGAARAVAIQADGKIVVAGEAAGDFAVMRYHRANGSLDSSFGGDGIVTTDFGTSSDVARAIAIQADGRIVVAGFSGNNTVAIARYNANGTLDTTFNGNPTSGSLGNGRLRMSFGSGGSGATGLAIQRVQDGNQIVDRIVVVGHVSNGVTDEFAVARFTGLGNLDLGFGGTGIVTSTGFGSNSGDDRATAVAIQANGSIVVAGTTSESAVFGCFEGCFAVRRFSPAGVEEIVSTSLVSFGPDIAAVAHAMTLQTDGKIVVVGTLGGEFMALARYNADLTPDSTFGTDGRVEISNSGVASSVAIQPDGKIVVAGTVTSNDDPTTGVNVDFALVRLNANGQLDGTFNGDGRVRTSFSADLTLSTQRTDGGFAVAIQPNDGRIVVAGGSRLTSVVGEASFAVARYHAFTCNGANVTILGTNGPDTIFGLRIGNSLIDQPGLSEFNDVIHGLGGDDIINGLGGNDIICGGDGNDTLIGGRGSDVLIGGGGSDAMDGGSGTDTCVGRVGFPGDSFTSCETVNTGLSGLSGEWITNVEQICNRSIRHPSCVLHGQLRVFNPGAEATAVRSLVAFYLSEDDLLDENDTFLGTMDVRALGAGGARVVGLNVRLPVADVSGAFVIAVLDYLDNVPEINEANNVVVSPPVHDRRAASVRRD